MARKTLDSFDFHNKRVLVRVDLNVPLHDGVITDNTRIKAVLPTIHHIADQGGRVILLSHFGRPKGKICPDMSLSAIGPALSDALKRPVTFADTNPDHAITQMKPGDILLLENIRFHKGEEANDPQFAAELAALGDIYVNDAFSASHRAHASIDGLARCLPAAAGCALEKELSALEKALKTPERPLTALVGGAKISTKLALLRNLSKCCDHLIVGGGMANTFLAAKGVEIGRSLAEHDMLDIARETLKQAAAEKCQFHLPLDIVTAPTLAPNVKTTTYAATDCPKDAMILDIGPQTVRALSGVLTHTKTLVWNGPLGAFEYPPFNEGTDQVAQAATQLVAENRLTAIAGGGDTVAALNGAGVAEKFSYVSSAGGAFLEWMEGKILPGIQALEQH